MSSEEQPFIIEPEENPIIRRYPSADDTELNVNVMRLLKNGKLTDEDKQALLRILYKALGPLPDMLEYWDLLDDHMRLGVLKHLSDTASGATKILAKLLYELLTREKGANQ